MLIAGEESIREIIPFPMNKNAQDVMMGAPAEVEERQLRDVHIQIVKEEKEKTEKQKILRTSSSGDESSGNS